MLNKIRNLWNEFKTKHPKWVLPTKIGLVLAGIGLVLSIIGLVLSIISGIQNTQEHNDIEIQIANRSEDIKMNMSKQLEKIKNESDLERTDVEVTPKQIEYTCNGIGVIKNLVIRNYNDSPLEDFTLTISWPANVSLNVEVKDIDSWILQGVTANCTDGFYHKIYYVPYIAPKSTTKYDLTLLARNCSNKFLVSVNKYSPITYLKRARLSNDAVGLQFQVNDQDCGVWSIETKDLPQIVMR